MAIEVTVRDTETGETETTVVKDYALICADPCHVTYRRAYRNGTHVLTIKDGHRPGQDVSITYEDVADA